VAPEQPEPSVGTDEVEDERQTTPFLVLQFFIFPMSIVAVCVAVFVVFGLIASEGKSAQGYLDEVRTGSMNRRWQAAFELSKVLQAGDDPALHDDRFVSETVSLFEAVVDDDPRVQRFLALALGRLGDARAVAALATASRESGDPETRIYAVWALGAIADPAAVPDLVALSEDEDAGVRKTACHALGSFSAAQAQAALAARLQDGVADVRWNAAIALGRRGDPRAQPELLRMLDREWMGRVPDLTPPQLEAAMTEAVVAAGHVDDPEIRAALKKLRGSDPNLSLREAARVALAAPAEES